MEDGDPQPTKQLVTLKVNVYEVNLDKLFLSSAYLDETATESLNRAIAFYYAVMATKPGDVVRWEFSDGSVGRIRRLTDIEPKAE